MLYVKFEFGETISILPFTLSAHIVLLVAMIDKVGISLMVMVPVLVTDGVHLFPVVVNVHVNVPVVVVLPAIFKFAGCAPAAGNVPPGCAGDQVRASPVAPPAATWVIGAISEFAQTI